MRTTPGLGAVPSNTILPAILPAFAKTAWLANLPEFNPFKYNSFPVNGARQAFLLTRAVQQQIHRQARDDRLVKLPPILTFQSVLDSTVSAGAVVSELYGRLLANGSELVLFDVNRHAKLGLLVRPAAETMVVLADSMVIVPSLCTVS